MKFIAITTKTIPIREASMGPMSNTSGKYAEGYYINGSHLYRQAGCGAEPSANKIVYHYIDYL